MHLPPTDNQLELAIRRAINERLTEITQEEVEEVKKRLEKKVPEIIAGVALRLQQNFNVMQMQNEMVLQVRLEMKK